MEKYLEVLQSSNIFRDIAEDDILHLVKCLSGTIKRYKRNNAIFEDGEAVKIGIVLDGVVQLEKVDSHGNLNIVQSFYPSDSFGEAIVINDSRNYYLPLYSLGESVVIFIDFQKVVSVCTNTCKFHMMLIKNMMQTLAVKNYYLSQKIEHMTKRNTREKVLSYLIEQSKIANNRTFTIKYNRQGLADFLSVDRSGLSNELCKLRDEGIIAFCQNKFQLL